MVGGVSMHPPFSRRSRRPAAPLLATKPSRIGAARNSPRKRVKTAVVAGLSASRLPLYASRLLGALPQVIRAPAGVKAWRSALVGPAQFPSGYRDVVILTKGRLIRAVIRQAHRDGNVHTDPCAEVERALQVVQEGSLHGDRAQRPLIPLLTADGAWLRSAARTHGIPIAPGTTTDLLARIQEAAARATADFRTTLDPDVSNMLPEDELLTRFHNWLADERMPLGVLRRRRDAYAKLGPACDLVRKRRASLDRVDDPVALLADLLKSTADAVSELVQRNPGAFSSFDKAQRQAWALELMTASTLEEFSGDLDRAGAWAGRAISFAALAYDNPQDQKLHAGRMLRVRGLPRVVAYDADFTEWSFADGREQFRRFLDAIVRFGLLPAWLREVELQGGKAPSAAKVNAAVRTLARDLVSYTIRRIELASRMWRKVEPRVHKHLLAASYPAGRRWTPLFKVDVVTLNETLVNCIDTLQDLRKVIGRLGEWPTLHHDILFEGSQVVRLWERDEGQLVAVTVITHDEIKRARREKTVAAEHVDRSGWALKGQWRRWMRVIVAQTIFGIARKNVPVDMRVVNQKLAERRRARTRILRMPCRFDHHAIAAAELAEHVMAPILRRLVPDRRTTSNKLFSSTPLVKGLVAQPAAPGSSPKPTKRAWSALYPLHHADPRLEEVSKAELRREVSSWIEAWIKANKIQLRDKTTRFVVIDTETTGLDTERDRIVEVGAIEMIGPRLTGRKFSALVNPTIPIPADPQRIHGISDAMVRLCPTFDAIAPDFLKFIGDTSQCVVVAHGAAFDMPLVKAEFARAGVSLELTATLCTKELAQLARCFSLDDICSYLRIPPPKGPRHRADVDALLCARVLKKLIPWRP